jgi:predicted N-acetyltransferase YhbS
MGKTFPQVISLREKPSCFEGAIRLIENSFQYSSNQSFVIDFAPLMDASNHHNCFLLVDENEYVLAHVGVKERTMRLNGKDFNICMLGGIAVDENQRGKGFFQKIFQDVLAEKRSNSSFFLLWSDQEKLYSKYGFSLCGGQYELAHKRTPQNLTRTSFSALTPEHQWQLKALYQNSFKEKYQTLERSSSDWELISKIHSADLFIEQKDGQLSSYFFVNKGQDLEGIVYEYGSSGDWKELLEQACSLGKVWMGAPFIEIEHAHYQFLLCPGDLKHFSDFIFEYSKEMILIRNVNTMKQEVFFDFNSETLVLPIDEFLRGILGPEPFEELGDIQPLFVSGLDSV